MRSESRIPFDPREARVVGELARWMGLLGRFQVVGATFLFILLLAAAALVTTVEVLEPAVGSDGQQPLVRIGEVSRTGIAIAAVIVVGFSLAFFRGGTLLISAAEDLETVASKDETEQQHLETALRRLRIYFVMESVLMMGVAAAAYAATILRWPGLS